MLEIPESYNIANQLNETIKGKKIINVIANASPHKFVWFNGNPEEYNGLLKGREITGSTNYGGMVEVNAEGASMVFSDGLNIRYYQPNEELPLKHQLFIEFDDASMLICGVQMYGGMAAFKAGEYDNDYYIGSKTKTSPLSDKFDYEYFMKLIENSGTKLSAKAFLATEQRIPGLGNGVLQDILFNSGISPMTKMSALDEPEIKLLFEKVKATLKEMSQKGGRDTEKDIFGNEGGYRTLMSKKTIDSPCPHCGGEIIKKAYMGGSVYYCPICQPEKK
ncbi:MAG: endonuclease VIII [Clostridia bacterium]|nr:endonuclease VIII [Clostridia bacterium]